MKVYTFSEARQNFASVLENAQKEEAVRITHRDGRTFTIQPVRSAESPLAVKGVKLKLSRDAIVAAVRESRKRASGG
jgi:prevent-host-death family protein